ncbi:uncharacterized protein LOC121570401 isoform X1 [Coregonus clupeaformis]|uniref:uncharacterized protein LOC121570401 isoform X1 n=1 Tax=Coregonus clupeaformis TaxID=59861 RepID=UPI001E1C337D|nr:uncharacterized protein LOC121570401 isoform X1 [Coregonus clupeaformis]
MSKPLTGKESQEVINSEDCDFKSCNKMMKQRKTEVLFGWFLAFWLSSVVNSEITDKVELRTSAEVKAQCDQNVALQCDIISSRPLKIILFSWVDSREMKELCVVNATGVFPSPGVLCDNTNNSLTLTLTQVMPSSQSNYVCKLRSNLSITAASTTVTLQECLRTSEHKVFQNESQVECQFFGVYPEGTVHWFLGSENITESASTESQQDEDGLFDIRSTLPTQAGTEPYNCSLWIPSSGTYSSHKLLPYSRGEDRISSGTRTRSRLMWVFILVGLILIT